MVGEWGEWCGQVCSQRQLNSLLEVLGLAMSPRKAIGQNMLWEEMFHCPWGKFQTYAFHVVSSIGPIVSDVNLHGWQNSL